MSRFTVPSAGIPIDHSRPDTKHELQTVRLKLSKEDARDLVKHVRNGGPSRLRTGRQLAVEFGSKRVSVHHSKDNHPQELFAGPVDGSKPMYFSGQLSHCLEVQQAREATAGMDSALETLKNTLKQTQEDRVSQEPGIGGNKLLKAGHRPSPLSAGLLGSRPSSPFLGAGLSPRTGPTSAPLLSGQFKQEKIRQDAIRIPVMHLLAMEPQEPSKLATTLRARRTDIDQVLHIVARDGKGGKKELKDRSFRNLDVWKFPYQSQGDRQIAIDNAISAYDRMRVEKVDSLWQMLLAKEDRGKGIYLSKLNFDRPLPSGNLTPRLNERSTDGTSTEGKSMNSLGSGDSSQKGKAAVSKPTDKPKLTAEQMVRNIKKLGQKEAAKNNVKNTPTVRENKKSTVTKADSKFKSSEKVIDSDEDAATAPAVTAPTTKRKEPIQKSSRPDKTVGTTSKAPLHKPHLSGSSGSSDSSDRGRLSPASAMVRTRGGKETTDPAESSQASSSKGSKDSSSQVRNVSRSRNGSSPAKPSPLGSSPPANQRDADTSSNSSKGTTLSSAPSSPPSTTDASQGKGAYSPVIPVKKTGKVIDSVKRKAEAHDAAPTPKKQQTHTNGTTAKRETSRFNALPGSLTEELDKRTPAKRDSPVSDASSTSVKSVTKEQIIEDAKRFQKYYTKYKDLHDKVDKQKDSDRKDEDVDTIWTMHKRLSDMKGKIWRDWDRIDKAKS